MKVLMISGDRSLFDEASEARRRVIAYATSLTELHIIVTTTQKMGCARGKLAENVWIYPTNSAFKAIMWLDTIWLGKRLPAVELVTSQDPFELGYAAKKLAEDKIAKLQIQIHTDFMSPEFVKGNWKNKFRLRLMKGVLENADGVRVVSERIKDSLVQFKLKHEPVVLPLYADVKRFVETEPQFKLHTKYPQFNFIVLMMSRLEPEKDIPTALRAFKELVAKDSRAGIVIVGDGSEKAELKKLAHDLGIENQVVFAGWQKDTVSYFKSADVFLNTSLYEGYGVSLIEAAASKCAIVTTNVGVAGELLKNHQHALIASVRDSKAIAKHLIDLMGNNALRERLSVNAREEVLEKVHTTCEEYLKKMQDSFSACF